TAQAATTTTMMAIMMLEEKQTDVGRFVDGGIFIGNLRRPIDEVIPKLEKKLSDEAGREVVLWFMEEQKDDITKQ
ncbi:peptidase M50 family, partial [Trifolium pratense]